MKTNHFCYILKAISSLLIVALLQACSEIFVPDVKTGDITEITYCSVICNAYILNPERVTEVGFYISDMNPIPGIGDTKVVAEIVSGTFGATIIDLKRSTKYYIRPYAINKEGIGYGEVREFTTHSGLVPEVTTYVQDFFPFQLSPPPADKLADKLFGQIVAANGTLTEIGFCYSSPEDSLLTKDDKTVITHINLSNNQFYAKIGNDTNLLEYCHCSSQSPFHVTWDCINYKLYKIRAYAINEEGIGYGNCITLNYVFKRWLVSGIPGEAK